MDFFARAGGMAVAATQAVGRGTGDGKHEPRSIGTQEGVSVLKGTRACGSCKIGWGVMYIEKAPRTKLGRKFLFFFLKKKIKKEIRRRYFTI